MSQIEEQKNENPQDVSHETYREYEIPDPEPMENWSDNFLRKFPLWLDTINDESWWKCYFPDIPYKQTDLVKKWIFNCLEMTVSPVKIFVPRVAKDEWAIPIPWAIIVHMYVLPLNVSGNTPIFIRIRENPDSRKLKEYLNSFWNNYQKGYICHINFFGKKCAENMQKISPRDQIECEILRFNDVIRPVQINPATKVNQNLEVYTFQVELSGKFNGETVKLFSSSLNEHTEEARKLMVSIGICYNDLYDDSK